MAHLDFAIKIVSPAFIAGTMQEDAKTDLRDSNDKIPKHRFISEQGDGLRVPSLRGVLRFWFRAMHGHLTKEELFKEETKIFGSAETGQGIRLVPAGIINWNIKKIGGNNTIGGGTALAYLGYGPINHVTGEGATSHNKSAFRDAISEDSIFKFRAIGTITQIKMLEKCLILLHLFGGVGSRSRRGFGSVTVIGLDLPEFENSLIEWFGKTFELIWNGDANSKPNLLANLPKYSSFSSFSEIKISKHAKSNYEQVIQIFHDRFKETRLYKRNNYEGSPQIAREDHDLEAADSSSSDITRIPLRLAFGMPYNPQSQNNHWKIVYKAYYPDGSERDRRASPLFLKVFDGPDGNYYAVSLFLKAEFFGVADVEIGQHASGNKKSFSNWHAVEEFMNCSHWDTIPIP